MLENELQKKYSEQVLYLEGRGRKEGFHSDERLQVDSSHILKPILWLQCEVSWMYNFFLKVSQYIFPRNGQKLSQIPGDSSYSKELFINLELITAHLTLAFSAEYKPFTLILHTHKPLYSTQSF